MGRLLLINKKPEKVNQMLTPKPEKKSRRELEIARELARLLNVMPFEFMLDLQSKLLALQDVLLEQDLAIKTEQQLTQNNQRQSGPKDLRRLDIVVPLAPLRPPRTDGTEQKQVFREIVFELKLYQENLAQVNGYAEERKDALVVSIYQTPDPAILKNPSNVVQVTWTDLFWGLLPLLDLNAQRRVIGLETPTNQMGALKFDYRKALGSVADHYLEDFLLDIKPLAKTNFHRVIVVTGATAVETANKGIYFCPTSWDMDFDYLCVVYDGVLQYVGKVELQAYPVKYALNAIINNDDFDDEIKARFVNEPFTIYVNNYDHGDEGAVTWLKPVTNEDNQRFPDVKVKFAGKGAVTYSHRYFDSPEAFKVFFNTPKPVKPVMT